MLKSDFLPFLAYFIKLTISLPFSWIITNHLVDINTSPYEWTFILFSIFSLVHSLIYIEFHILSK